MALKYQCPSCDSGMVVAYLEIGQPAKCKSCGEISIVPEEAITVPSTPPKLVSARSLAGGGGDLGERLRQWIRIDLVKYLGTTVLLIVLSALIVFTVEPSLYEDSVAGHIGKDIDDVTRWDTFWHTIWWSVVTFTTVGYGDVSPNSHIGKLFGMLIMFAGYTWNIILGGVVASLLVMAGLKEVDELDAGKYTDHTVILGWNPMVEEILQRMQTDEEGKPVMVGAAPRIALVNEFDREELGRVPQNYDRLDIVHLSGRFTQPVVLEKALVQQAGTVVIVPDTSNLSDPEDPPSENDTLPAVYAIRDITTSTTIVAHTRDAELKGQLLRASCSEVVLADDYTPDLIAGHVLNPGAPQLLDQIIRFANQSHQLVVADMPPLLSDSTHIEVFNYFKESRDSILLGYAKMTSQADLADAMGESGSPFIRDMIKQQMQQAGIQMSGDEQLSIEIGPADDYQVDAQHSCILLARGLNVTALDDEMWEDG